MIGVNADVIIIIGNFAKRIQFILQNLKQLFEIFQFEISKSFTEIF